MKKKCLKIGSMTGGLLLGFSFLTVPAYSSVELIENGDFEIPAVSSGNWSVFADGDIPGWTVEYSDEDGNNAHPPELEIWNNLKPTPYSGNQHAELDGYDPTKISQNVPTEAGKHYVLRYAWAPRPGVSNNQMKVWVDGEEIDHHSASGGGQSEIFWTEAVYEFDAVSNLTNIAFAEVGPDDQLGMLLDAVSLTTSELNINDMDVTGIIFTRNWESYRDQAQFKMKGLNGVAAGFCDNSGEFTIEFGPVDGGPIYTYTGFNIPYDMDCHCNRAEECVVNIRNTDLDNVALDNLLTGEMTVSLDVDGTTYTNTGVWEQFDSGSGSWTKYRKD